MGAEHPPAPARPTWWLRNAWLVERSGLRPGWTVPDVASSRLADRLDQPGRLSALHPSRSAAAPAFEPDRAAARHGVEWEPDIRKCSHPWLHGEGWHGVSERKRDAALSRARHKR